MSLMTSDLNPQQLQAVQCENSCLAIAGPGTGKTHTLTARINYLLTEKQIPAEQILALTFTKKAAEEIKQRTGEHRLPFIGTIHAWTYWFLQHHHPDWQIQPKQIISEAQQKEIIKSLKQESIKTENLLNQISLWKQSFVMENRTFLNYQNYLQTHHLVDFDDLLIEALDLLRGNATPGVPKYTYILVDEFQDLNQLQFTIISELVKGGANIFAVGDPYQSIYGFRGGSPDYFNKLKNIINGIQIIKLTDNYRSSQNILDLANKLFPESRHLKANQEIFPVIKLIKTHDHLTEAYWICQQIRQLTGASNVNLAYQRDHMGLIETNHLGLNDVAILCRTHELSRSLEEQLTKDAIPYQKVGEKSFLEYPEIQQIVKLLEKKLIKLSLLPPNLSLINMIDQIIQELNLATSTAKAERLQRLKTIAHQFPQTAGTYHGTFLHEFLQEIRMLQAVDEYQTHVDKVTLATLHAAKGLEFSMVFIVGLEEGLLPYQKSLKDEEQTEEEKRLLYVGLTRAKQYLYMTVTKNRTIHGEKSVTQVSRFWKNLQSSLIDEIEDEYAGKYLQHKEKSRQQKRQMRLF